MANAALSLLAAFVSCLPPLARVRLGEALGWLSGSVLQIRRALVEAAMRRAGVDQPSVTASTMYRSLGVGLCELLWLSRAPSSEVEQTIASVEIDAEAESAFEESLARGPVILLASHTGNWELAAAAAARLCARRGRRLFVVAKAMSARVVDAFLIRLRKRLGVEVIPPRGAFGAARAALASGDVVVMPIDQVPDRAGHGLDVRFLREAALADRAPATLAWRARATALVVAARRMADDRIRVSVLEVIPPVQSRPGMRARPWIDTTTKAATMALEAMVLRTPESWMWLHRRWKAPRSLRGMRQEPLVATDEAG